MRASRLLSILILLQLRVRVTADSLAEEFGVSVRTIYRDVDELSSAGIPIYGDRGPGGGFQLVEGYRTKLTGLASDEAQAMLMIGLPGPAAELGLGQAAARAKGKMLASLPPAMSADAGRIGTRFHLDPVDWYRAAEPVVHLPVLAQAVLDQQRVAMKYESWTTTREWEVEPLGLVLKAGTWYAVARDAKKTRTFKVAKILELSLQEARFERPTDFDLPTYWRESMERFERDLRPGRATLRATVAGLERIAKLGAYAAEAVGNAAKPGKDGWAKLEFPYENIEQAALALLGIGPEVEVKAPEDLRFRLRELALAVAKHAR